MILTYIFEQAALIENNGVASMYHLRNEQYGMDKDDDLLHERFQKEIGPHLKQYPYNIPPYPCPEPGLPYQRSVPFPPQ